MLAKPLMAWKPTAAKREPLGAALARVAARARLALALRRALRPLAAARARGLLGPVGALHVDVEQHQLVGDDLVVLVHRLEALLVALLHVEEGAGVVGLAVALAGRRRGRGQQEDRGLAVLLHAHEHDHRVLAGGQRAELLQRLAVEVALLAEADVGSVGVVEGLRLRGRAAACRCSSRRRRRRLRTCPAAGRRPRSASAEPPPRPRRRRPGPRPSRPSCCRRRRRGSAA